MRATRLTLCLFMLVACSDATSDPSECPATGVVEGEPCTTDGLHCGVGFEDPGQVCVGPELVWAVCRYYHQASGGPAPPNGCPTDPPTVGAPCCQGLPSGGPPPGCAYPSASYDCIGSHWIMQ